MGFGDDEEILQDFLVEAGEILELLSEQLVELEQSPDDTELLNAIFRGFHTIKGGAGFLQIAPMVDCCHVTENLFDILRTGKRGVTPALMDVVLEAVDTINAQFEHLQVGQKPDDADPDLIHRLGRLVVGDDLSDVAEPEPDIPVAEAVAPSTDDQQDLSENSEDGISDGAFNNMLAAISEEGDGDSSANVESSADSTSKPSAANSDSDDITDDEFEALLDQLHGDGMGPTNGDEAQAASANPSAEAAVASSGGDDGVISDDEFEHLLDELHGDGKGPTSAESASDNNDQPANSSNTPKTKVETATNANDGDDITEDEFDQLLDSIHGQGKGPSVTDAPAADNSSGQAAVKEPASTPSVEKTPEAQKQDAPSHGAAGKPQSAEKPAVKAVPNTSPSIPSNNSGAKPDLVAIDGGATANKPPAPKAAAKPPGKDTANTGEATVRVDTQRLDDIMNMVGELVLVRNRLVRLGDERGEESLTKAVSNLDVVTADLQTAVMKTRMQPIKKVFGRFPRVVRDLARSLKKEISLELVGEDTDLDKNLVEALADPLVHLVRNSVDHGVELPDVREQKGKPREGKVVLSAQQEGDHILLSIRDDGGGMDPNKLRSIAVEKGVLDEDAAARLTDKEAFALIFAPGFSTKTEISDVSGRGVGMDVVKTKITQLNGTVEIDSEIDIGTNLDIKVPLTLAIMPTLMIMLDDQTFALPLVNVDEIFHMDLSKKNIVDGQECITIRDKAIPIFHLKRWLVEGGYYGEPGTVTELSHVVIVSVGTHKVGFVVDQLIGQEEVVIKPLGKMLQGTPGMAGATITGDGTIALILDVPSMLKRYAGNAA